MMRTLILLLAVLVTASPLAGVAQSPPETARLPTVELPPPLDRVLRDYERAWRRSDAAGLAALFTEDGFVLQSNRAPIRGRPAIEALYRRQAGGDLRLRALAFATSEGVGYIIGAYGYGEAPADQGKFTLTLRRGPDQRWLIASDMDNGG